MLICLCAGGVISAIISIISLWYPVPFLIRNIGYVYAAFSVIGIIIALFAHPGIDRLIETADSLGLRERVTTAWFLRSENTAIARLQREDAYKTVSETDFRKLYPLRFPVKPAIVLSMLLMISIASFMVPTYAKDTADKTERLKNAVDQQIKEIEKIKNELKSNEDLKETDLENILAEIERLEEELKKSGTKEAALKALSRTEYELEKLDIEKQLNKLGEALKRSEITEGLGNAVQNGNVADIKQALEQLLMQMEENMATPEELAEMLRQAQEQVSNSSLKEQLENTADKLESDNQQAQKEAVEDLGDKLAAMALSIQETEPGDTLGEISEAIQQARKSISGADNSLLSGSLNSQGTAGGSPGKSTGKNAAQESGQHSGSGGRSGGQSGSADENERKSDGGSSGNGQNQGNGKGQGSGQGLSQGSGQGVMQGGRNGGGSGAGEGTTNTDSGYTGGEGQGQGRKAGEGYEEVYEQLYDPDHLGGSTDPSYVGGQRQDGGSSSYTRNDQMPVMKGTMLPYKEILGKYGSDAASYMEKADIPAAMKEIVRKYFESLE